MTPYSQQVRSLAGIRTRLNKFSEEEQGLLINWGYALADAGLRAYVVEEVVTEGQWPVQRHALNRQ